MQFWDQHEKEFTRLYSFAIEILSIPATETPCERGSSWTEAFFNDSRASMKPDTLKRMVFVYGNNALLRQWREPPSSNDEDDA